MLRGLILIRNRYYFLLFFRFLSKLGKQSSIKLFYCSVNYDKSSWQKVRIINFETSTLKVNLYTYLFISNE